MSIEKVKGTYSRSQFYGVGSSITLNSDSSFEYYWQQGIISGKTNGTYTVSGNKVIFNSYTQPKPYQYKIISKDTTFKETITVKLSDQNNTPIEAAIVQLHKDKKTIDTYISSSAGIVRFSKKLNADSLICQMVGFNTVRLKLDRNISEIQIMMVSTSHFKYFTNESWTFKRNRLYPPDRKPFYKRNR